MNFAAKAIDRAQHISGKSLFGQALTEWMMKQELIAYDPKHDLFWVNHPQQGWQVAVWMMDYLEGNNGK